MDFLEYDDCLKGWGPFYTHRACFFVHISCDCRGLGDGNFYDLDKAIWRTQWGSYRFRPSELEASVKLSWPGAARE